MIKKTLVTFLILFCAYTFIVTYVVDPNRVVSEHQWQDNQIKTQRYLFSDNDSISAIIVGSSLSERLHMNMLPHFYNLGLLGLGAIDGLATIKAKGNYPKYIFIETNHIDRPLNDELKNSIENPLMTPLRRHFISLRDGKQPLGFIAIPYAQKATAYGIYLLQFTLSKITSKQTEQGSEISVNIFDKMLTQSIEQQNKIPLNLDTEINILKKYVEDASRQGSTIIFFEMPIQQQLCGLPRPMSIRKEIYKHFLRNQYRYIDIPDCAEYRTTDGEHLDYISAKKYTEYLKKQIESLGLKF